MCEELLNRVGMKPAGVITNGNPTGRITLTAAKHCTWKRGIYAWVEIDAEGRPRSVLYVGKAGKTLAARCRQHTSGLADTTSKVNRRNSLALQQAFERGNSVLIYARESATARVFGREVTMNDAEEEAAIYVLKPTINSRRDIERIDDAFVDGTADLSIRKPWIKQKS